MRILVAVMALFIQSLYSQNFYGGDSFNNAETIPSFNEKHTLIKNTTDSRYVKFDLKRGEGVTVRLTAHVNSDSLSMHAYTPDNQSSPFEQAYYIYDGQTKTISFTATVSGTYYFKISGSAGLGDIEVYQSFYTAGVKDDDFAYHSSSLTAKYITSGNHAKDKFDHWHRFIAHQGDEITIGLTAHVNSDSLSMHAYTPDNQSSPFEQAYYIYDGQTKTISFTAQLTGVYYLKISGPEGNYDLTINGVVADADSDNDGLSNSVEMVRGTRPDKVDTNENGISDYIEAKNGKIGRYQTEWSRTDMASATDFSFAKPLPYFDVPFSLDKDTNDKYIKFSLQSGEDVVVLLTAHVNSDSLSMHAYTPDNQSSPFKQAYYIYDGKRKMIAFTASSSGTYYLKVAGSPGVADMAIYKASTSECIRDFHSTFSTAYPLRSGNHVKETDWSDYYRFDAELLDNITIDLTAHINSDSLHMYLYKPSDHDSAFKSAVNIYDGQTKTLSFEAYEEGTYYLKVKGAPGNYDLNLTGINEIPKKCDIDFSFISPLISYILY